MNKKITLSGNDWTDKADDYFKILGMGIDATNKIVDLKNKIDNNGGNNNNNTSFQDRANERAIDNDNKRVIKKKDDNTLLIVGGCIAGAAVIGLGIWAVTK